MIRHWIRRWLMLEEIIALSVARTQLDDLYARTNELSKRCARLEEHARRRAANDTL